PLGALGGGAGRPAGAADLGALRRLDAARAPGGQGPAPRRGQAGGLRRVPGPHQGGRAARGAAPGDRQPARRAPAGGAAHGGGYIAASTRGRRATNRVNRPSSNAAPGSLASCCDSRPAIRLEPRACPSSPAASGCSSPRSIAAAVSAPKWACTSKAGAYARSEGSKPGTGRQNISWASAWLAITQRAPASSEAAI